MLRPQVSYSLSIDRVRPTSAISDKPKCPWILFHSPVGLGNLFFADSLPGHMGGGAALLGHLKAAAKETDGMGGV